MAEKKSTEVLFLDEREALADQRHSDGAYFAGKVPAPRLLRPRAVAVATVNEPQAQSMAP
jgi:hypothetical protein